MPAELARAFPAATHEMLAAGYARMLEYQDHDYAQHYVRRLTRILAAERAVDPAGLGNFAITSETARYLALWMAFDDIVRVADLKCRASRYARRGYNSLSRRQESTTRKFLPACNVSGHLSATG